MQKELEEIVEGGRRRWVEAVRRETTVKVAAVREAVQTDFTIGIDDSHKNLDEMMNSVAERTKSLESKFMSRVEACESSSLGGVRSAEKELRGFVERSLEEREKSLQGLLKSEAKQMNDKIKNLERIINEPKRSRVCTIS